MMSACRSWPASPATTARTSLARFALQLHGGAGLPVADPEDARAAPAYPRTGQPELAQQQRGVHIAGHRQGPRPVGGTGVQQGDQGIQHPGQRGVRGLRARPA